MATSHTVLNSFSKSDLFKIANQEGIVVDSKATKKNVMELLISEIEDSGVKQLTAQMKLVDLDSVSTDLSLELGEGNRASKTVLRKRLTEFIKKEGLQNFLENHTTSQTLALFVRAANEEPIGNAKDKLVTQAAELINLVGFTSFLSKFDTPFLQHLMKEANLKFDTDSKDRLVYALATHSNAKKKVSSKKDLVFSDIKLPIEKGVSFQDVYQHYFKQELVEWSKENGLKVSGKKKEVILRILAFLDGDKENTMSANTEEKPAKEEKPKSPKKAAKQGEKKHQKKQKEETTGDEPEEEEEEKSSQKKASSKPPKSPKKPQKRKIEEESVNKKKTQKRVSEEESNSGEE